MARRLRIHYDNQRTFTRPYAWVWEPSGRTVDLEPTGKDTYGFYYDARIEGTTVGVKFKDGPGRSDHWESVERQYTLAEEMAGLWPRELWCKPDNPFFYDVQPALAEPESAEQWLGGLRFPEGMYIPGTGGLSGLGANVLDGRGVQFGLFHPTAGRVFLAGTFNGWHCPGNPGSDPSRYVEMKLYRGYGGRPNLWLATVPTATAGDEYKFYVQGGVPRDRMGRARRFVTDPCARELGRDAVYNNAVVVDPTRYRWREGEWQSPRVGDLILYEMSVYGFTEGDWGIPADDRGRFDGVSDRIEEGYFDRLGVTALSLMPLHEIDSRYGPTTKGYEPTLHFTVERDFGRPDDFRRLVDLAHRNGLAVLVDQVMCHTSNRINPLWEMVLEHPSQQDDPGEGGLYFSGSTPWGNRLATEREEVQNLLIDACKLMLVEYRVDGFRFDATHSDHMDHGFLRRLARELQGLKADVILVAENLPNQPDLNLDGPDGFAQWSDLFHKKAIALLTEAPHQGQDSSPRRMGEMFYFCRDGFATHTHHVVNYTESHDEHSVAYEVGTTAALSDPASVDRKGRLGLMAAMTALGQPMIYMGQEFNLVRSAGLVRLAWPEELASHGFFQWARRLIRLRRRYPGLRISGSNPIEQGDFAWVLAPWMGPDRGQGLRVIGWRTRVEGRPYESMVVLLNFEPRDVRVDVAFGQAGTWIKLADIDRVNDIPPEGTNGSDDPAAVRTGGVFGGYTLPPASGFIYKRSADA